LGALRLKAAPAKTAPRLSPAPVPFSGIPFISCTHVGTAASSGFSLGENATPRYSAGMTSKPTLGLVALALATLAASAGVWLLLPPGPRVAWTSTYGAAFTPDSRTFITYDRKRGQV